ncbi:MAG: SCO1664 family protein [Actinomycetota bacterium]
MPGDERAPELDPRGTQLDAADAERLLAGGNIEILGLMPRSSNYTFLAKVVPERPEDPEVLAIYKPRRGEQPLWDFPDGTLANREVAAFRVATQLGWPFVPPTVLRDGPEGPGSVQLFLEFDPQQHFFTLFDHHESEFRQVAVFDAIANNADRKGGHTLLAHDGRVFVIDHGVCFNAAPKLRTVIWEFEGEPIEADLLADLERLRASLDAGSLGRDLAALLTREEIDATLRRTGELLASKVFPSPGDELPYPWPAI